MKDSALRAERLHIVFQGRCNSGKSSLINALTGQRTAIVSDRPGTTTDPVAKAIELPGLGACVLVDTPGFDDAESGLGTQRVERTSQAAETADIAVLLIGDQTISDVEADWLRRLETRRIPIVIVLPKADLYHDPQTAAAAIETHTGHRPVPVSVRTGEGLDALREALVGACPGEAPREITAGLAAAGDTVLLVMPQDAEAPKGRLILPQVQTIRELLDKGATVVSCTADGLATALAALAAPPKLIITDSQVFARVAALRPASSRLTSFSILFARYKGDIGSFVAGAEAIGRLDENARILIAEACTHAPLGEDIGRVKLPALLRKRVGAGLRIDFASGADFPRDLTPYALVIHCGACMFNRRHVMNRIRQAREQGIPMTNYGVAIAYLQGILGQVVY